MPRSEGSIHLHGNIQVTSKIIVPWQAASPNSTAEQCSQIQIEEESDKHSNDKDTIQAISSMLATGVQWYIQAESKSKLIRWQPRGSNKSCRSKEKYNTWWRESHAAKYKRDYTDSQQTNARQTPPTLKLSMQTCANPHEQKDKKEFMVNEDAHWHN